MVDLTGLSVRVSAQTASFTAGMNRVKENAGDAALALRRLSLSSESAERDIDSAGRSASTTAIQFGALTSATNATNTSFMGLSATTIGALVPAIVTLGAALAPVLAALTGFVAVAGAIGGIGLVSVIGAIAVETGLLRGRLKEIKDTILTEFGPAFELAASVLHTLLVEFEDIIPQLVPADDVLSRLAGNFSALGRAIIEMLPAFVDLAVTLTDEFLPPFVTWVQDVLPGLPDTIESLVGHFREFLPMLMDFGRALGRLLPPLTEFGWTALRVIAPALGRLNTLFIDTLDFINGLSGNMDQLVAQAALIAPVLAPLIGILGGPLLLTLGAVGAAVYGLARAFQTNFGNIRTYLTGLWNEFQSVLPALQSAFDAFVSGIDFEQITNAVSNFESVLGDELMQTLEELGPVFDNFKQFLSENEEEFALIGDAAGEFLTSLINISTTIISVLFPAIRSFLIPALMAVIDAADLALSVIGDMISAFQEVRAGDFQGAMEVVNQSESPAALADLVTPGQDISQEGLESRIENQIEVIVEGELPEESIRNVSVEEINNQQRQTRRNQGRTPRPN